MPGLPRPLRGGPRLVTVAAVVLAAGGSRRLGRPKQLLAYRARPLLDATLAVARRRRRRPGRGGPRRCRRRGARAGRPRPASTWCANPDFGDGCAHLDPDGARRACRDDADGIVLLLGDQPRVRAETVGALVAGAAATPSASASTTTASATRSGSIGRCSTSSRRCTATRRCGSWSTPAGADVVRVADRGPRPARRRHLGRLRGAARGAAVSLGAGRPPRRCAGASTSTATSPTRAWRPRSSSPLRLGLPLLLEGEPGVGKTAAAQVLAALLDAPLVRLQCYEGLTAARGALRLELPAPAARHPARRVPRRAARPRPTCSARSSCIERPILRCVRYDGPQPPVLLDRRDRPRRRRVRGAAARGARRGLGDGARARHLHGRRARRSSCSPPTAAATCTTRCGGAASTTGWSTRSRSGSCAILRRTVPAANERPDRVRRAVRRPGAHPRRRQAARAWPRRSTGWPRCPRSARPSWSRDAVVADPRRASRRPPTTATPSLGVARHRTRSAES